MICIAIICSKVAYVVENNGYSKKYEWPIYLKLAGICDNQSDNVEW